MRSRWYSSGTMVLSRKPALRLKWRGHEGKQ
jgi:hypothetical protein